MFSCDLFCIVYHIILFESSHFGFDYKSPYFEMFLIIPRHHTINNLKSIIFGQEEWTFFSLYYISWG